MMTFKQRLIAGKATIEDADEYIERWHSGDEDISLHEYLGLSWDAYGIFLLEPDKLINFLKLEEQLRTEAT